MKFFAGFPDKLLEILEKSASVRKFRKNSHIIVGGEESLAVYVLQSGTAYAFTSDEEGNEFIVGSFGEGDCFGELGLLDSKPRTASVVTTSNCECLVIAKSNLLHAIESDAAIGMAVIQSLVGRIRGMTDDVSCLALMDVYGRLARVIQSEATERDDGTRSTGRITHRELASRVGSSREMISKILKDLRIGGYIDVNRHCIVLRKSLPDRW
ncbi:MAG: Crp/Fnr family transcriptional regulator [Granulosicoccus sp.]